MWIFNKKRLTFIMLAVFLPIGMFALNNANNNLKTTVETMATPATSKTIVIDAGHGGEDERC